MKALKSRRRKKEGREKETITDTKPNNFLPRVPLINKGDITRIKMPP